MKKLTIAPIGERVKQSAYMPKNSFVRALMCMSPEFVYYYLNQIVTLGAAYLIGTGQYGTSVSQTFKSHSLFFASSIRVLALIIAVLPLLYSFKKEYPVIEPQKENLGRNIGFVLCLSLSLSLLLNVIAIKSGFTSVSSGFSKTASAQFSLPVWLGIPIYGIITPVTEEIVHRGIIYNRLRRFFDLPIALVAGALLFGISHGNLIQFVYAFLMGLMIGLIYERFGSFIYPMIFHCMANTVVYITMSISPLRDAAFSIPGMIVQIILCAVSVYMLFGAENIDTSKRQ
jgi:membrane protease YdiL (CAAX protease family)